MSVLEAMRAKYGFKGGKYEPNPACKFCNGAGERQVKKLATTTFCICLFVDHGLSDFAGESLGRVAADCLKRIEGEG